jgi:ketosteroid isomerase-like protein
MFAFSHTAMTFPADLLKTYSECYHARNVDGLTALFAEDAVVELPGQPKPVVKGHNEIRAWLTSIFSTNPTVTVDKDTVRIEGDQASYTANFKSGYFEKMGLPDGATMYLELTANDAGKIIRAKRTMDLEHLKTIQAFYGQLR